MAYHTLEEVAALLHNLGSRGLDIDAGKPLPRADVERYMAESEQRINQRLRGLYRVPVEDPEGQALLGYIAARLTAATVWRVLQAISAGGESRKALEWERQALDLLEQIARGEVGLGHAERATGTGGGGIAPDRVGDRTWRLGREQW